ncbi:SH3 domain-containing protein [Brevundimonas sp.]
MGTLDYSQGSAGRARVDGSQPVSSKSRSRFQSLSRRMAGVCALLTLGVMAGASATMPDGRPTPTGLEVPRWLTLKSSEVRARSGPGLDYRILWEYRAAGLPVQVIAETREWRKICDPEGSVAWVHRSVVSARRGAFNASLEEVPVRSGRSEEAGLRARFSPRSVIALDDCKDGWCEVRARKLRGWVAEASVFGTGDQALCDASRPAGEAR